MRVQAHADENIIHTCHIQLAPQAQYLVKLNACMYVCIYHMASSYLLFLN